MNRKSFMLFAALGSAFLGNDKIASAQGEDRVAALKKIWEGQNQKIASAYIRCRGFRSGVSAGMFYPELRKLLDSVDVLKNPDDLKKVIRIVHPPLINTEPPWSVVEYFFQGAKVKEITRGSDTQLSDGQATSVYSPVNAQTQIYKLGDSKRSIGDLQDFRYLPIYAENLKFEKRAGNLLTLSELLHFKGRNFPDEVCKYVVEAASGMVLEQTQGSTEGEIGRALVQKHFVDYPGGIRFPSLVVQATFNNGQLNYASITLLEEARFNEELPKDTFQLAVPAGTRVFDKRKSDSSNFEAMASSNDVVQLANERPLAPPMPQDDSVRNSPSRGIQFVMVAVGIALAVFVLLRTRRAKVA